MSRGGGNPAFSAREIRYLQSLPAVERVTGNRITYTDEFKRECVRRYNAGESPSQIFRRAGLDSSLVGYKRIERCVARWRRTVKPVDDGGAGSKFDVPESRRWAEPVTPPIDEHHGGGADSSGRPVSYDVVELLKDSAGDAEVLELIIVQQARRIQALERQVIELQTEKRDNHER